MITTSLFAPHPGQYYWHMPENEYILWRWSPSCDYWRTCVWRLRKRRCVFPSPAIRTPQGEEDDRVPSPRSHRFTKTNIPSPSPDLGGFRVPPGDESTSGELGRPKNGQQDVCDRMMADIPPRRVLFALSCFFGLGSKRERRTGDKGNACDRYIWGAWCDTFFRVVDILCGEV